MVRAEKDKNLRWNFAMGLLHGVFVNGSMAFSNPITILSVFLNIFTHSKVIVGLFSNDVIKAEHFVLPFLSWKIGKIEANF